MSPAAPRHPRPQPPPALQLVFDPSSQDTNATQAGEAGWLSPRRPPAEPGEWRRGSRPRQLLRTIRVATPGEPEDHPAREHEVVLARQVPLVDVAAQVDGAVQLDRDPPPRIGEVDLRDEPLTRRTRSGAASGVGSPASAMSASTSSSNHRIGDLVSIDVGRDHPSQASDARATTTGVAGQRADQRRPVGPLPRGDSTRWRAAGSRRRCDGRCRAACGSTSVAGMPSTTTRSAPVEVGAGVDRDGGSAVLSPSSGWRSRGLPGRSPRCRGVPRRRSGWRPLHRRSRGSVPAVWSARRRAPDESVHVDVGSRPAAGLDPIPWPCSPSRPPPRRRRRRRASAGAANTGRSRSSRVVIVILRASDSSVRGKCSDPRPAADPSKQPIPALHLCPQTTDRTQIAAVGARSNGQG